MINNYILNAIIVHKELVKIHEDRGDFITHWNLRIDKIFLDEIFAAIFYQMVDKYLPLDLRFSYVKNNPVSLIDLNLLSNIVEDFKK